MLLLNLQEKIGYRNIEKAIKANCMTIPKPGKNKAAAENTLTKNAVWNSMVQDLYALHAKNLLQQDPAELLAKLRGVGGRFQTKTATLRVAAPRYFIRATDATKQDIENRERCLEFKKVKTADNKKPEDPLAVVMANIAIQKRAGKGQPVAGDEGESEDEGHAQDMDTEDREQSKGCGGTVKVWPSGITNISDTKLINGDVLTGDMPEGYFNAVFADPPWGYKKFAGDAQQLTDQQVRDTQLCPMMFNVPLAGLF